MIIKSTNEICEAYADYMELDEPIVVFINNNNNFVGSSCDTNYNQVVFFNIERDYKKIWEQCPNAVRIGEGESSPYDKGIIGYVKYDDGNGRIVYDTYKCIKELTESWNISYDDAYEHWEYNILGSVYTIPENQRPYLVDCEF